MELDNLEDRFAAIREFAEHGLHAVLYLKPIGPWTDIQRMTEYLSRYQPWITEVIMAPLKGDVSSCGKGFAAAGCGEKGRWTGYLAFPA